MMKQSKNEKQMIAGIGMFFVILFCVFLWLFIIKPLLI